MFKRVLHISLYVALLLTFSCSESGEDAAETGRAKAGAETGPVRIVSMAPNITEIAFALGLGDRIVGVSDFCDYPAEALKKPRIGGVVNPNMEAIVALNPDLVLTLPNATHENLINSLRMFGIKVVAISNDTLDEMFGTIRRIGEETSRRTEAEEMSADIRAKFSAISEKVADNPRKRVMLIVGIDPLFVAGKGTFIDELIKIAGGENIAGDSLSKYPQMGMEEVVSRAPEVIFYTSLHFGLTPEQEAEARRLWDSYPSIPAVKNGEIHGLVADYVTLSGPRLTIGLEEMARAIHPERFEEEQT